MAEGRTKPGRYSHRCWPGNPVDLTFRWRLPEAAPTGALTAKWTINGTVVLTLTIGAGITIPVLGDVRVQLTGAQSLATLGSGKWQLNRAGTPDDPVLAGVWSCAYSNSQGSDGDDVVLVEVDEQIIEVHTGGDSALLALAAHEAAANPHPGYETAVEAQARVDLHALEAGAHILGTPTIDGDDVAFTYRTNIELTIVDGAITDVTWHDDPADVPAGTEGSMTIDGQGRLVFFNLASALTGA